MRQPIDLSTAAEAIHAFPAGADLRSRIHLEEGLEGNEDLYFDRASCTDGRFRGNIFRIRDVNMATPLLTAASAQPDGAPLAGSGRPWMLPGATPAG